MNRTARPAGPSSSRRSLLRGGIFLGLSAVASCAKARTAPSASVGQASTLTGELPRAGRLIVDYQPSRPTGWAADTGYSPTIGGHISSTNFTFQGKKYRISLLPSDPAYKDSPGVKFRKILASAWGAHYSFRYTGSLPSGAEFTVESYSAWAGKPIGNSSGTAWGADLYVVYHPGRSGGQPAVNSDLQFIQVIGAGSFVDNAGRANPFYGEGGGLASVNGDQSVSFYDHPRLSTAAKANVSGVFTAEVFLAQDTGIKDAAGKSIVKVFGGVQWGWQVRSVA